MQTPTSDTPHPRDTGKSPAPGKVATSENPENFDPCAEELHKAAGALLLYFSTRHRLPDSADELKQVPGFEDLTLVCPVSHRPYVYDPRLTLPGFTKGFYLIFYDAEPSHGGKRWALSIAQPQEDAPLVAKVVLVPNAQLPPPRSR